MNKEYLRPQSAVYICEMDSAILRSSPQLKDEQGSDEQLSNKHTIWDKPEWESEE